MADTQAPRAPAEPPDPHRRAWDAMPWVVAGSAPADEAAWLQQHTEHCEACREELGFQQALHRALRTPRQAASARPAYTASDTEAALQRLMARIDDTPAQPVPRRAPWLVRGLVAAVVVQSVGLATAALALWDRNRDDAAYRTWSVPAATRPASVRLVPAPGMDMATLRTLLATHRLEIVEAAADAGSLGLVAADGRAETLAAALSALRSHPGVRLAEPTGHAAR